MRSLRAGRCIAALVWVALGVGLARPAVAQEAGSEDARPMGVIIFNDGAIIRARILESVEGDHVSVQLPGGESARFDWSLVRWTSSADSVPAFEGPRALEPPLQRHERALSPRDETAEGNASDATALLPSAVAPNRLAPKLALGVQSGYGTPLGYTAIDADFFPSSWFGFELGAGLPTFGSPFALSEGVMFNWPMWSPRLEMGLGISMAQRWVSFDAGPLQSQAPSQVVNYLNGDCSHITYYFGPSVALRTGLGITFPIGNGAACDRATNCAGVSGLNATAALLWNIDFGGNRG